MTTIISNPSGDHNEKIANAAKVLGRSKHRKEVFREIYNGKKKIKTAKELADAIGISNIRVLQEADKLSAADIIKKIKENGETAYQKIDFYTHRKKQILSLSDSKKKLDSFPTKSNPKLNLTKEVRIVFPKRMINIYELTIDEIDSFKKVKATKNSTISAEKIAESKIKEGFKKILGETGKFTDWGGELNDLFSSRLILNKKRISVAFGFKGRATKGSLVPKKLGKNGDQIQRLFKSPAQVFIIQYHGQIDQSVVEQMKQLAIAKSVTEMSRIYYGIIDGKDTSRLLTAYPKQFK